MAVKMQVADLSLWYGSTPGLKDVSVDIEERSVTAIIGPSGCGKSSFLRTLNRMNDHVPGVRLSGSVLLDGQDVYARSQDPAQLRKRVGMVFQRPNPFPMTIYQNVAYGPRVHGQRSESRLREIVEQSLRRAALWDEVQGKLQKSAFELSGGQQQRLCIARALAVEPEVLLMDEPASALDPVATAKIEELIVALKETYTLIVVTHNMQQAGRISDRTAFFLSGELIEYGPTRDIFTRPRDARTEDYVTGRFG